MLGARWIADGFIRKDRRSNTGVGNVGVVACVATGIMDEWIGRTGRQLIPETDCSVRSSRASRNLASR